MTDVFLADGSLSETIDCNQVNIQASDHTTDWITDFRKQHVSFRGATIEEGSSQRIVIPKCAVMTSPLRGYGESAESEFVYVLVVLHMNVSYLWLLCRICEMSPRLQQSIILSHKVSENKDANQLEDWVRKRKRTDFETRLRGEEVIQIGLRSA